MSYTVSRVGRGRLPAVLISSLLAILMLVAVMEPATSAARARLSVSPQDVAPGDTVTTNGRGFPSRVRGSITFGGETVSAFTASRSGTFSKQWVVPDGAESGAVLAKASSRRASADLQVSSPEVCSDGADNDGDGETD